MKLKVLALTLSAALSVSIEASANEPTNSGFDKYRERLVEIGHTEEEILQMENEYNINKMSRSASDVDLVITDYLEGMEKYNNVDFNKEVTPKSSARAVTFDMVEPGDIILEPDRASGFGHTSCVYVNTTQVVEALKGQVSSLNSTKSKWNDFNSRQYWMWVPRYNSNTRARAAGNGFQYLNKPYSLLASKSDTDKFYCSLLNWRQYKDYGIDLDSDGGPMVLPFDIYWHDDVAIYLTQ